MTHSGPLEDGGKNALPVSNERMFLFLDKLTSLQSNTNVIDRVVRASSESAHKAPTFSIANGLLGPQDVTDARLQVRFQGKGYRQIV